MLCTAKTLRGYKLDCLDGAIGQVKEFYFDDRHWTVRYLIADSGTWLPGRQVLISPYALGLISKDRFERRLEVNLTKKQIENSPSLESDKPVSRQFEESYYDYYLWPRYWGGPNRWGSFPYLERAAAKRKGANDSEKAFDHHLRSTQEVMGYHLQATDGEIGHVEDFILEDETWTIRYLIVSTLNWWPGKKVLIAPQWAQRLSWGERTVFVDLSRETIKESPEYTGDLLLNRDYEAALHQHYNRHGYWTDEPPVVADAALTR